MHDFDRYPVTASMTHLILQLSGQEFACSNTIHNNCMRGPRNPHLSSRKSVFGPPRGSLCTIRHCERQGCTCTKWAYQHPKVQCAITQTCILKSSGNAQSQAMHVGMKHARGYHRKPCAGTCHAHATPGELRRPGGHIKAECATCIISVRGRPV